ncbi:TonB-dependent receptor, partial [bacterium]|nr:TonB-dependent receptor [bacterium]
MPSRDGRRERWTGTGGLRAGFALLPGLLGALGLLGLAGLLAAGPASAGVLTGRVIDARTGEALAFASVVYRSAAGSGGVIADGAGRYRTPDLPAAEYTVSFHFIGYETLERRITVAAEGRTMLPAPMESTGIRMEKVVVKAQRVQPRTRDVHRMTLTNEDIRALPAFGEKDPIRTLQFLPGVQAASDISSGLYVRGGGPDQTLVLLDGVPVYNPTHAFGLFSTFNADVIDEVTLYKGAYPARTGGRLGAVLDVRGRNGSRDRVHGSVGVSMVAGRIALDGPVGGGTWLFAARRTYLDPVLDQLRKTTSEIPSYYFYDANAKLSLPIPGRAGNITLQGFLAEDDLHVDFDEGFVSQGWGNRTGSVAYRSLLGGDLLGTFTLMGSRYTSGTNVEFFTTPIAFSNRLLDLGARAEVEWDHGVQRGAFGVEGRQFDFEYRESFNGVEQSLRGQRPHDFSAFAQEEVDVTDATTAQGGLRVRYFSEGARVLWEPRASLEYAWSERLSFQLAGGVDHQYLQLVATEGFSGADLYVPLDDSVEPGVSYQGVFGTTWEPSERWSFGAEVYGTALRNLIVVDNNKADGESSFRIADTFRTGGEGYATGLELFAQKRTGAVRGWLGYTLGWTRRRFDEVNGGEWFAPKYDRRHDVNAVATWDSGPWTWSSAFVLGTGQAFTPASARWGIRNPATGVWDDSGLVLASAKNSARLLPYHRLDVSVARRFTAFAHPAEWTFQVFNLYSRRNEWFVQYD